MSKRPRRIAKSAQKDKKVEVQPRAQKKKTPKTLEPWVSSITPNPPPPDRWFTRLHLNLMKSQADDLQEVSNRTGMSIAMLIRHALLHWFEHRDPKNPLAFRCMYPKHEVEGTPIIPNLPGARRASPPPEGKPDHRVSRRRPYRVPASETQNGEPFDIPHEDMVRFADLLDKDFKKHPDSKADDQARRIASKMGWSPLEAMSAMTGLDEGYLDADSPDDEEEDE